MAVADLVVSSDLISRNNKPTTFILLLLFTFILPTLVNFIVSENGYMYPFECTLTIISHEHTQNHVRS